MNWVFINILLLSVGQTVLCGFSFPLLISFIGRAAFLLRLVGSVIPIKVSLGFEAADLFFVLLGIIFARGGHDWVNIAATLLFCALVAIHYLVDDSLYLYVVADEKEEE